MIKDDELKYSVWQIPDQIDIKWVQTLINVANKFGLQNRKVNGFRLIESDRKLLCIDIREIERTDQKEIS